MLAVRWHTPGNSAARVFEPRTSIDCVVHGHECSSLFRRCRLRRQRYCMVHDFRSGLHVCGGHFPVSRAQCPHHLRVSSEPSDGAGTKTRHYDETKFFTSRSWLRFCQASREFSQHVQDERESQRAVSEDLLLRRPPTGTGAPGCSIFQTRTPSSPTSVPLQEGTILKPAQDHAGFKHGTFTRSPQAHVAFFDCLVNKLDTLRVEELILGRVPLQPPPPAAESVVEGNL